MRRPVFRRTQGGMALFPFLAVLICTMGSLIVLLVMILHQARVHAANMPASDTAGSAAAESSSESSNKDQEEEREKLRELLEQLQATRDAQTEKLKESRLALGHLEEHLRSLEEEGNRLNAQLREIENSRETSEAKQQETNARLARIQELIAQSKEEMERLRAEAKGKQASFAILPYVGPNGTRRRPIYVECTEEGILIHPENILLMQRDFAGPMGPGNPLDACLRAIREYLSRSNHEADQGEPYPLLIVRPSGIMAYGVARAAMKPWENEFGYELIDEETTLSFPPADPNLEQILVKTLRDARERQELLAAAMPSRYKGEPIGFVASGSGGLEPVRGGGGGGVRSGGGSGGSGNSGSSGTGRNGGRGSLGEPSTGSREGSLGGRGTGGGGSASGKLGKNSSGTPASGSGQSGSAPWTSSSTGSDGDLSRTGPEGDASATGTNAQGGGGSGGKTSDARGNAPGSRSDSQGNAGTRTAASSGRAGTARGSSSAGGSASAGGSSGPGGSSVIGSASGAKGPDWALPDKNIHSTAVTRPIRVQVYADRIVIRPERGEKQRPKTIALKDGSVRDSIETFVDETRQHMDGWGLAVMNGYWQPILRVEVAPNAETQFSEFERLLRDSGFEVERRK